MKQLVIMPGGFHPFHPGHYSLYQSAVKEFPGADVYVAATADTSTRPFPFEIKQKLARLAGVPADKFVQVKSPFQAREITSKYDPEDTQLIFVRSDKDHDKQPIAGGTKKDGTPSYLQPYSTSESMPLTKRGYMAYLPTVEFGPGLTGATEIRTAWPNLNEKRKIALVMSLYPATQKNPKLAQNVVKMLDSVMGEKLDEILPAVGAAIGRAVVGGGSAIARGIGSAVGRAAGTALGSAVSSNDNEAVDETTLVNDPERGIQIRPEGGMGTWTEQTLVSRLSDKFTDILRMLKSKDYTGIHYALQHTGPMMSMIKALADLQQFQDKQGNRLMAKGKEIKVDTSKQDYVDEQDRVI